MLEIGIINRAHGLNGEVLVNLLSNVPERLHANMEVFFQNGKAMEKLIIEKVRIHKNRYIVTFEGIATRDAANNLRGTTLLAEPLEKVGDNQLWLHKLVNCEVFDQHGKNHGKVHSLEANPASDLLVLESGALVPSIFVESFQDGIIKINAPEGLLE